MKTKVFKDPVLHATIWATYSNNNEEITEWYKQKQLESQNILLDGWMERIEDQKTNIIIYHVHVRNPQAFYTIQHETVHLINRIFEDRNIYYDKENDEIFAYYLEYWFRRLWRYYGNLKPTPSS